jgi:hypothetical protein
LSVSATTVSRPPTECSLNRIQSHSSDRLSGPNAPSESNPLRRMRPWDCQNTRHKSRAPNGAARKNHTSRTGHTSGKSTRCLSCLRAPSPPPADVQAG